METRLLEDKAFKVSTVLEALDKVIAYKRSLIRGLQRRVMWELRGKGSAPRGSVDQNGLDNDRDADQDGLSQSDLPPSVP